ncbi:MAG: hypothetical protein KKH98_02920 [Spirochaetes bacterium]|nr:hypothetical protein [Spirochaetota bacterium]
MQVVKAHWHCESQGLAIKSCPWPTKKGDMMTARNITKEGVKLIKKSDLDTIFSEEGKYRQYNELLMAVERKFPNESRHETALRYIREAEQKGGEGKTVKNIIRGEK